MTLSCKSLILNKTDDNHSHLLFDIFYKKNLDIRVYPYAGHFYELAVCGAPAGRPGNGTRKGCVVYKQHPHAPNWCVNRYIPYVLRRYNTVV